MAASNTMRFYMVLRMEARFVSIGRFPALGSQAQILASHPLNMRRSRPLPQLTTRILSNLLKSSGLAPWRASNMSAPFLAKSSLVGMPSFPKHTALRRKRSDKPGEPLIRKTAETVQPQPFFQRQQAASPPIYFPKIHLYSNLPRVSYWTDFSISPAI